MVLPHRLLLQHDDVRPERARGRILRRAPLGRQQAPEHLLRLQQERLGVLPGTREQTGLLLHTRLGHHAAAQCLLRRAHRVAATEGRERRGQERGRRICGTLCRLLPRHHRSRRYADRTDADGIQLGELRLHGSADLQVDEEFRIHGRLHLHRAAPHDLDLRARHDAQHGQNQRASGTRRCLLQQPVAESHLSLLIHFKDQQQLYAQHSA